MRQGSSSGIAPSDRARACEVRSELSGSWWCVIERLDVVVRMEQVLLMHGLDVHFSYVNNDLMSKT